MVRVMKAFLLFCSISLMTVAGFQSDSLASKNTSRDIKIALGNAWHNKDCVKANQLIRDIRKHDSEARFQFYKAEAYEFGQCVERDIDKAIEAYKTAYKMGATQSKSRLGSLYVNEKKDLETAQKWFRAMAFSFIREPDDDVNTAESVAETIELVKQVYSISLSGEYPFPKEEFDKAVNWANNIFKGSLEEMFAYSLTFEAGTNGYPINGNAADRLFHRSLRLGFPPAAWHKAQKLLKKTKGRDDLSMYRLLDPLKIAAKGGIIDAQVQVGRTYRDFNLKTRHLERAYEWFIFARKNGAQIETEIENLESRIPFENVLKIKENIEENGSVPK